MNLFRYVNIKWLTPLPPFAAKVERPKSLLDPITGLLREKSSVSSNQISLVIASGHRMG